MKILLLGKNGQVGWELQRSLQPLGEVLALDAYSQDYCGDLADIEGLGVTLQRHRPDVIVNAAAYTAVDQAESDTELASRVNAEAVMVLARYAAASGALLVHYSTDYVYPGSGSMPWRESDPVAPLNAYGRSKLQGEQAIRTTGCSHLIFRTSWVYATKGHNFAKSILRLALEHDSLGVVDDQYGAPTSAELLADVTALAIRAVRQQPHLGGVYNLAASGETTWCRYARHILERAIIEGYPTRLAPSAVYARDTESYPTPAPRPLNSRLATEKLQLAFSVALPNWKSGVDRMLNEFLGRSHEKA